MRRLSFIRCACSKNDLDATERGEYGYGRLRASSGGGAAPAPSSYQTPGMRVVSVLSVLAVGLLLVVTLHPGISPISSGTDGAGIRGPAIPGIQKNKQDPSRGMCRYKYGVPTWAGEEALACDPAVCEGADKLQVMATPSEKQRRWSTENEAAYMNSYRKGRFEGWLHVSTQCLWGEATPVQLGWVSPIGADSVSAATQSYRPMIGCASVEYQTAVAPNDCDSCMFPNHASHCVQSTSLQRAPTRQQPRHWPAACKLPWFIAAAIAAVSVSTAQNTICSC